MKTEVVDLRYQDFDVYIGRGKAQHNHFGNPFAISAYRSRDEVCNMFEQWLGGDPEFADVEPERRVWILEHLEELRGKRLGCFCHPLRCHGDFYVRLLEG
jgi:hypothetical protein